MTRYYSTISPVTIFHIPRPRHVAAAAAAAAAGVHKCESCALWPKKALSLSLTSVVRILDKRKQTSLVIQILLSLLNSLNWKLSPKLILSI